MNSLITMAAWTVSASGVGTLLLQLVVGGLIFWVVTWGLGQLPIAEPFKTVIRVVMILLVVIFLMNVLLSLGGHGFITF